MVFIKKINTLRRYKYLVALISVFNFLLTPIHVALTGLNPANIVVINYTLVILASSLIAGTRQAQLAKYVFGALTLICIWFEYTFCTILLEWGRLLVSFLLFLSFCILLVQQLVKIKQINLHFNIRSYY